uniref:Uncharacterized protein n=1 Tax=Cacopsylla melanoneura TaxID=428564 RepID=A0A8D8R5Z3_9HEMI
MVGQEEANSSGRKNESLLVAPDTRRQNKEIQRAQREDEGILEAEKRRTNHTSSSEGTEKERTQVDRRTKTRTDGQNARTLERNNRGREESNKRRKKTNDVTILEATEKIRKHR